jgi:hypothetical protein
MADVSSDKSNTIVETSLTELAFIFFFILLAFTTLKITELVDKEKEISRQKEQIVAQLVQAKSNNDQLITSTLPVRQAVNYPTEINPDDIFEGLQEDMQIATSVIERQRLLEQQITEEGLSPEVLAKYVEAFNLIREGLSDEAEPEQEPTELAELVLEKVNTLTGQNANLRRRLSDEGNGLDHPPCWADELGNIQYVYAVTINEGSMIVDRAWPEVLQSRVDSMPFIAAAIGQYEAKRIFWRATNELYQDSVANECRHFVRVDDKAISKDAFKSYLLAIERHFYKLLL